MLRISFWSKDTGNLLSHKTGLTQEQIMALKELKEGDRLVIWLQQRDTERHPSYTMKKFQPKEK
jgi:hypothetical protein